MSKKPAPPLPNIILVSQSHTNGLFHDANDLDALVDCLMENISMTCFCTKDLPDYSADMSIVEKYISEFAMWKVICRPNLQFSKQDGLLCHEDLYDFVKQGRESIGIIELSDYSCSSIDKLSQDLTEKRFKIREALMKYVADTLQESFTPSSG